MVKLGVRDPAWPPGTHIRHRPHLLVDESVMEKAGSTPEQEVDSEPTSSETPDERLSIFKDFVDTLDLDDLDENE